MKELLGALSAWQSEGVGAGRAVVVRTFGPAPRREGAVLLVADDGRIAGSVSGGCVETAAAEEIAQARRSGRSRIVRYGITNEQAWEVGLACGGTIDVLIEPGVRAELVEAARDASEGRAAAGRAVAIPLPTGDEPPARATVLDGASLASRDVLTDAARAALATGMSRTVEVGGRLVFVEAFVPRPRLVVVGAGQIAIALTEIARAVGFETVVVDGRAAFATRERFPLADHIVIGWPDKVADEIHLGPSDAVAVLSHDVKFDEPAIVTALRRGCRYVGAVGSRKTQADRRERLIAAGVSEDDLARLHGPIGLDLGGRSPEETALAILAEVVAERYGGSARPMSGLKS